MVLPGCTSGDGPPAATQDSDVSASPSHSPQEPEPTPAPSTPAEQTAPIEFRYQPPDPPCVPVSALDTLPASEDGSYALDDRFTEGEARLRAFCAYERSGIGVGPEEDTILEDHVLITSEITLFREWGDSDFAAVYPELPVASDDLDDWSVAVSTSHKDDDPWWEGCGPATPCADDEEPTVRTYVWKTNFEGHAGNLEFYVRVYYIAEHLPFDAESQTIEIFRDLVLAVVESRERVE
jgi:hypothetical protein